MIKRDLGMKEIHECMKNQYPFLMIDGITEVDTLKYSYGYKNFSINEWYFQGHFKDNPNVPGVILLEAMIETFIMSFLTEPKYMGLETADSQISDIKFLKKIKPGDRLQMKAFLDFFRHGVAKGYVDGYVEKELVCSCKLTVCIPTLMLVPHIKGKDGANS